MSKASKQRSRRRRQSAQRQPAVVEQQPAAVETEDQETIDADVAHSLAPVLAAAGPVITLALIRAHVYDSGTPVADEVGDPLPDALTAEAIREAREVAMSSREAERIEYLEAVAMTGDDGTGEPR